jgi:hypothetical protein
MKILFQMTKYGTTEYGKTKYGESLVQFILIVEG